MTILIIHFNKRLDTIVNDNKHPPICQVFSEGILFLHQTQLSSEAYLLNFQHFFLTSTKLNNTIVPVTK